MKDDAFGGHVIKRLDEHDLPSGVSVMDFGTGGLDLAYEVMRGYDALILVDASRQGGEPGTLYVMEPDPGEIEAIEDGEMLNPHGMDPRSVLRFVRSVGGWPGKVLVVACEPAEVDDMGLELSPAVEAAAERAVALVLETVDEMRAETAQQRGARRGRVAAGALSVHELSISSAIVDTVERHAEGRRVTVVSMRLGRMRQVVPDSLAFYFEIVLARQRLRGRAARAAADRRAAALPRVRRRMGSRAAAGARRAAAAFVSLPAMRSGRV